LTGASVGEVRRPFSTVTGTSPSCTKRRHPGRFLRDELEALNVSARKFAEHIHVPHNAVTGIMNGERAISAQMAIRLGRAFGTTPHYWLNLQAIYDLKRAKAEMPIEVLQIESYAAA
jgi:addiction module HigA family antidote